MDDSIRELRARHWQTITNEADEGSVKPPEDSDTEEKKTINFGYTDERRLKIETNDDSDADETYMRHQLGGRPSAPYSYIPPPPAAQQQSRSKREADQDTATTTTTQTPGSWPEDTKPTEQGNVKKDKVEREDEEPHVKTADTTADSAEERTCRICFSPATEEERLISPCKCRGTSKWIHLTCLNTWRMHSQNSKSFYRCDQCHYEYSFRRTDLANLLMSQYTLLLLTGLTFFLSSFLGGFVIKLGLFLMPPEYFSGSSSWFTNFSFFYTPLDAGTDMLQAASSFVPSTPQTWRDIFVIDSWHFVQGIISLGLLGLVTLAGTGGIFSLRTFGPRGRRARGGGRGGNDGSAIGLSEVLFLLVILLGCGKVILGMFGRVKRFVKRRLDAGAERILEVDP